MIYVRQIKDKLQKFFLKDYFGGFIVGLLSCLLLALNYGTPNDNFLYDYQTFISSMLLVIVGVATVVVMHLQYRDVIYRKRLSMKAQMPDDIIHITDYARECLLYIRDKKSNLPQPCKEAIKTFKNSIEFLETPII